MKLFQAWGRQGGRERARRLSPAKRSVIASHAAQVRWNKSTKSHAHVFHSVRLHSPSLDDPTYLQEILFAGVLDDWREIYRCLADKPFGAVAQALEKVLASEWVYGVTPLWRGMLRNFQGGFS